MDGSGKQQRHFEGKAGDAATSAFGMDGNRDIGEELPPLRAVSLRPQATTLHFSNPSEAIKLSSQAPFVSSKNASTLKSNNFSKATAGVGVQREWSACNWKVSVLNEVPLDFPLERTRREIENTPVADVVQRITNCLRLLSIEAEFDGESAKAKCKTSDMVVFRIRLFAGKSKTQEPIIVEIQRRSGSPRCFLAVCKKILDAAEGVEIKPETIPARKKMPPFMMKTPISSMKCLQNAKKKDPTKEVFKEISKSLEMIRSKKYDVNALGLESLCVMTDPLKTEPGMAVLACKYILVGQYCADIRNEIEAMVQKDKVHPFKEMFNKCHHLALVLLSNVLALTSSDGCLDDAVKNEKWFTDFLIPSLLADVKSFEVSSNNAYEAARSLTSLATCSDFARKIMMENSAVHDLHSANQFATYNHDLLESETRRSLSLLGHPI